MKTALSISNNRLAPVFDVARHVLVLEWTPGKETGRSPFPLGASPLATLAELKRNGVDQLVCGAISRPMQHAAMGMGIEVMGFLTGEIEAVVRALVEGTLQRPDWRMPGCRGQGFGAGRGRRGRCGLGMKYKKEREQ